jgi:tetratricopeptide (TPR) repeat protein
MTMKNFKIIVLSLIVLLNLVGCDSFVDIETPNSQLTGTAVFEDRTTANAALIDIYSKLRDTGLLNGLTTGSAVGMGLYADELTYYGTTDDNISFIFNNTLLPTTSIVSQLWNESYQQIYCANAVIYGCQNSTGLSTVDKNQFIGEALFVRALVHFYLMNLYGDVPYIATTDYEVNRLATRMPTSEVYNSIIADLQQAIALLPEAYVAPERVRPNRSTASALLARVYLFNGNWAEASNAASAVLNNSEYVWETDIDKIFLKDCTATIWQFSPKLSGNNADEGSVFVFQTGPPPFVGLHAELYNSFANDDLRKSHWIATVTDGTNTWYHANKYKQNSNTGTSVEYSIVFRLAEQYLIRAEARARQGELSNAKQDLDMVRSLAGLPNTTATTETEIIAAVQGERRFELFTEYGHRFFDLKRNGTLNTALPIVKLGWNSTDALWPIPETELLANPNLTPNPGY